MKKFTILCAAVAALVGCSKESTHIDNVATSNVTMVASIDVESTRVTVGGDAFTDVKWVEGDRVQLTSVAGASLMLSALEGGDTNVRFSGDGEVVADVDTYYAIYPAVEIANGVATVDITEQSGQDVAVLASKAVDMPKESIAMSFKPVNSLLHVAVSGVDVLSKAEFMAYDQSMLPQGFTYTFESDATQNYGGVASYTVEAPSTDGFFFSLPADLNLSNGYVVRLTDASGNVCTKAYNGKVFERGTTTRVDISWSQPTVSLGAKTSYSYYLLNQPATANSCANNVIYFSGDCSSTYSGIQNVYVSEVGFIVDGTTYSSTNGAVTWNKSSKSFSMSNITVGEWRGYNVEAYIVTAEHGTIKSSSTLYITGLPYNLSVAANDGTWAESGNIAWNSSSAVRLGYNLSNWFASGTASIKKSDFKLPTNVNVSVECTGKTSGTSAQTTTFTIKVSDSAIFSKTSAKSTSPAAFTMSPTTCTMNSSNATIECHNSRGTSQAASYVNSLFIGYANR